MNRTDFVPMRATNNSVNISDLVEDKTINLESYNKITNSRTNRKNSISSHEKISFQPNEITGRSTLYNTDSKYSNAAANLSVDDILSTSCAPQVRGMCETLRRKSVSNSTITSSNDPYNLARTADMSSSMISEAFSMQNDGVDVAAFSFTDRKMSDVRQSLLNNMSKEKFAPSELMQSQLIEDEIAWAQQCATIPTTAISKEAKQKLGVRTDSLELSRNNFLLVDNPDFSVGRYFNMRSEDLSNIVGANISEKSYDPCPLVDNVSPTSANESFLPLSINDHGKKTPIQKKNQQNLDASQTPTYLSLSAVDRALYNINLSTDDFDDDIIKKLMKRTKTAHKPLAASSSRHILSSMQQQSDVETESEKEKHLTNKSSSANKENIDPEQLNGISMQDTQSFAESLLNSSEFIQLQNTITSPRRSPLSSTACVPSIRIVTDTDADADLDEWPSTPIKSPHRRVRRKKSPQYQCSKAEPLRADEENKTLTPMLKKERNAIDVLSPKQGVTTFEAVDKASSEDLNVILTREERNDSPSSVVSIPLSDICSCGSPRTAPQRSISRCSSSSEFTHREGKTMPIKVTCLELSWPSTKLRTNVRKSMQLKNIANKRLAVRVEITGPGFQIVNMPTNSILPLQSQECRTIYINFCPTVTGAACGVLSFYPPYNLHHQHPATNKVPPMLPFLEIPLNAYGGHSRVVVQNVCKGPVGPMYIKMGDICDLSHSLEHKFQLYNTGSLPSFVNITINTVGLEFRSLYDALTVSPQCCLIDSGASVTISVLFQPRRDDIKKIAKRLTQVLTLAHLRIVSGDEANRQRMRRLLQQLNLNERAKISSHGLDQLWSEWPGEKSLDKELELLREQPAIIMDLLTSMKLHEIALIITGDDNLDETIEASTVYFPDADETLLFRTVCAVESPTPPENTSDLVLKSINSTIPNKAITNESNVCEGSCSVTPSILDFDFFAERRKARVSFIIHNSYKSCQYFEVICSNKNLLYFTPNEGFVAPDDGQIEIEVNSKYQRPPAKMLNQPIYIMVLLANERIIVPVKNPQYIP